MVAFDPFRGVTSSSDPQTTRSKLLMQLLAENAPAPATTPLGVVNHAANGLVQGLLINKITGDEEAKRKSVADTLAQALQAGQTGVKQFNNPDNPGQVLIPGQKPGLDAMASVLAGNPDTAAMAAQMGMQRALKSEEANTAIRQTLAGQGMNYDPGTGAASGIPGYAPAKAQIAGAEAGAQADARNKSDLQFQPQIAAGKAEAELPAKEKMANYQAGLDVATAGPKAKAAADAQSASPQNEKALREEFNNNPVVKNRNEALTAYKSIIDAKGRDSLASDLNIVYGFAKLMDPGSVVREGEQVMVTKTGGIFDQIQGWISSINGGSRLPPSVRDALVQEATSRMQQHETNYNAFRDSYSRIAQSYGADPSRILPEIPGNVPTAPVGNAPSSGFQPGQKVSAADVGKLGEGTVVTDSLGRDLIVRGGKLVPVTP